MKLLSAAALAAAVAVSTTASAAPTRVYTNQTDNGEVFPTVTAAGVSYDIPFYIFASTIPNDATITGIKYSFGNYANGYTRQSVQICIAPTGTQDWSCEDVSSRPNYTSSYFKDRSAKNSVKMVVTLTGGTYPAQGGQPIKIEYGYTYLRSY